MKTHITYVCEKEHDYTFNLHYLLDHEIDTLNYPIDFDLLFYADILIFQYTRNYNECLKEISKIHTIYQYKPIILVSDHFDSTCISWAITQKIYNIVSIPDKLNALNNLIENLTKHPYHSSISHTDYTNEPVSADKKNISEYDFDLKTRKAVDFMHNNYFMKVQISTVASLCNMSISTFTRIFKRERRVTFCQYLQLLRLCAAKRLLRNTNLPINQVAHMCGINDPAYFARMFKSTENKTPKEYRAISQ